MIMSLSTREKEEEKIEGMTKKRPINVGIMDQFVRPIKVDDGSMQVKECKNKMTICNFQEKIIRSSSIFSKMGL